jgi:hypothetical protein
LSVLQKITHPIMSLQQGFDSFAQLAVAAASPLQIRGAFGFSQLCGFRENSYFAIRKAVHLLVLIPSLIWKFNRKRTGFHTSEFG